MADSSVASPRDVGAQMHAYHSPASFRQNLNISARLGRFDHTKGIAMAQTCGDTFAVSHSMADRFEYRIMVTNHFKIG
jgi:hypothetical protein